MLTSHQREICARVYGCRLPSREIALSSFSWLIRAYAIAKSIQRLFELGKIPEPITAFCGKKRYRRCRDHRVADLLPQRIKPIAVVPREDRNVRRKRFLVGETLRLVLANENHCARPRQKPPIGLVVMIFVPDDAGP